MKVPPIVKAARAAAALIKAVRDDDPKAIVKASEKFDMVAAPFLADLDDAAAAAAAADGDADEKKRKELDARLTALEKRFGLK